MKVAIAFALAGILITGCSDTSTESTASNGSDTGQSNTDQTASSTDSGSSSGDQTSGVTDSSGSVDSDNTSSGSTEGADTGSIGATDGGSDGSATVAACSSTDVGIAFQGIDATVISDSDAAPSEVIDGCTDRDHSWSGDYGSIVTLDASAVYQMQGVYIWSTFARMEWIRIESSTDGLNWVADWKAVPTKPVSGPVYYGFEEAGAKRYVRVTGFGSDLNSWTNIAEVRWSLTGYEVSGERVYAHRGLESVFMGAYSLEDRLLRVTTSAAYTNQYLIDTCGAVSVQNWDATGHMSQYLTVVKVNGIENYIVDTDYVVLGDYDNLNPPESFGDIAHQYWNDYGLQFQTEHDPLQDFCKGIFYGDVWYNVAAAWSDYERGFYGPYTVEQDGFR